MAYLHVGLLCRENSASNASIECGVGGCKYTFENPFEYAKLVLISSASDQEIASKAELPHHLEQSMRSECYNI